MVMSASKRPRAGQISEFFVLPGSDDDAEMEDVDVRALVAAELEIAGPAGIKALLADGITCGWAHALARMRESALPGF